jgi:hypothetical protein
MSTSPFNDTWPAPLRNQLKAMVPDGFDPEPRS